jgi:hypothetical protein
LFDSPCDHWRGRMGRELDTRCSITIAGRHQAKVIKAACWSGEAIRRADATHRVRSDAMRMLQRGAECIGLAIRTAVL